MSLFGTFRTSRNVRVESAMRNKVDIPVGLGRPVLIQVLIYGDDFDIQFMRVRDSCVGKKD